MCLLVSRNMREMVFDVFAHLMKPYHMSGHLDGRADHT